MFIYLRHLFLVSQYSFACYLYSCIGYDALHKMTKKKPNTMRLEMELPSGSRFFRQLPNVQVEDEEHQYVTKDL